LVVGAVSINPRQSWLRLLAARSRRGDIDEGLDDELSVPVIQHHAGNKAGSFPHHHDTAAEGENTELVVPARFMPKIIQAQSKLSHVTNQV
jgi:hypothetical protein